MIDKKCPVCGAENCDDWPVHVGGEVKLGGCQDCWEKQCAESWHDMANNVGWIKLCNELTLYREAFEAAEAVIKYLITRNHNGFIGLNFPQYLTYQSIKQEAHHE